MPPAPLHLLFLVAEDWVFVSHRLPLAKAAQQAGYRVTVATRVREYGDIIRQAGIDVIDLPFRRASLNPVRELFFFLKLVKLYRRLRPDIVHQVAMKPVVFGSLAARIARVPAVVNAVTGLGYVFSSPTLKARLLRPFVRLLLRLAFHHPHSALIVQNCDDRDMMVREGFAAESAVKLIRGVGIDINAFSCSFPPAPPCLVILPGRLLKDKGVCEFVEAARRLRAEGLRARFALVGEPDPENPTSLTQGEINQWVAEGVIEYWGWQKDMASVLAQSHIVCLPSYREGLSKALLEAMAAARPIVTTNVPGCREAVTHGLNGLLVPARNAEALANALRMMIDDEVLRKTLGTNGRRRAETEFTSAHSIGETLGVYRELRS